MSVKENKAIVKRWNDEIWNKGNVGIVDELADAHYVGHPGMSNRETFKQFAEQNCALFPERKMTFEDIVAEGDMVMCRWTMHLTHSQAFMGVAPTGKKLKWVGISIYRIVDGKIAEDWACTDVIGLWKQLGTAPPMDQINESTWD